MFRALSFLLLLTFLLPSVTRGDDWPQWRGPNRDGVWNEKGVIDSFAADRIPHKWSVEISPGYCGPTVANGRVFVMDRPDFEEDEEQTERVLCFDAASGQPVWSHSYVCQYRKIGYQAGPRASVTIDGGQAFALGSMGHLHALDARTGDVLWKSNLGERYDIEIPIWGIAAAPLVYEDAVILMIGGRPEACVVALHRHTGQQLWTSLADRTSYSAPILIEQGGKPVVICWTGDRIVGLNPDDGQLYWDSPLAPQEMVIAIATPVFHRQRLFVTSFYDGSKMLKLDRDEPNARELWRARGANERNTEALHSIMSTPVMIGDYLYGVDSYGELRCLEAATGKRIWENQTATPRARWSNIHMVRNGDRIWMFNERGELLITSLSPEGFREISRAQLLEPTTVQLKRRGEGVCWSHPAFANGHVFARSDERLICASLLKKQ